MAVFRVEKSKNFTVMSNIHLRDKALSLKAKGLLSLILSLPDNWQYSIRGLAAISKESDEGIATGLRELEKAGYLVRHQLRGEDGRLGQIEYVIFESPRAFSPCTEKPVSGTPGTVVSNTVSPCPEETAQQNTKEQIQEKTNIESSNNLIISNPAKPEVGAEEMREDRIRLKRILYENVEYQYLVKTVSCQEELDELIEIALDALSTTKAFLWVNGNKIPSDVVRSRLLKLNSEHIEYILDCLHENTSKVRNIRQYLLAALYNAPTTISHYYTALVNHDMYG